ncbi:MAG TPA: hypothetical protein PKW77_16255 [Verrucomicrobiota bacterium]|nr:hypothetical protein [Verrucomicrobiota bacterium]
MKKPDKISLLASLRRQATEQELGPAPVMAVAERPVLPPPVVVRSDSAIVERHPPVQPPKSGNGAWLERTSITLKAPDRDALRSLTLFLVQEGQQHVQTSTVIQAALQFAASRLGENSRDFLAAFEAARRADRRKTT